jgi:hypothetical protein
MESSDSFGDQPSSPEVRLKRLYNLVGHAVVVPIPYGEKGPRTSGWQTVTYEQSLEPDYQERICECFRQGGNLGLILGPSSDNLVDLDIDEGLFVLDFLEVNPKLRETLRRVGKRGCGFMIRMVGDYPIGRWDLKLRLGSKAGEWRAGGGHQSVIFGRHPERDDAGEPIDYKIEVARRPIEMRFEDFVWPKCIARPLPWEKVEPPPSRTSRRPVFDGNLDKRIRAYLATMDDAVSGQGGHVATFKVACVLIQGWALSIDEARCYLHEYNARCKPPWSEKDLEHKLADAVKEPLTRVYGYLRNADAPPSPPPSTPTPASDERQELVLPIGGIEYRDTAQEMFPVLAERHRYSFTAALSLNSLPACSCVTSSSILHCSPSNPMRCVRGSRRTFA